MAREGESEDIEYDEREVIETRRFSAQAKELVRGGKRK
jgi:hypothetical protein